MAVEPAAGVGGTAAAAAVAAAGAAAATVAEALVKRGARRMVGVVLSAGLPPAAGESIVGRCAPAGVAAHLCLDAHHSAIHRTPRERVHMQSPSQN